MALGHHCREHPDYDRHKRGAVFDVQTHTRVFFSEENPQLQALEALENTYRAYNVLFALAPKGGKVFSRETLRMIEELTEAAWQIPYSSRVDSLSNFQYTWAEEDDLIVEEISLMTSKACQMRILNGLNTRSRLPQPALVEDFALPVRACDRSECACAAAR